MASFSRTMNPASMHMFYRKRFRNMKTSLCFSGHQTLQISILLISLSAGAVECADCTSAEVLKKNPMRLPVGRGWRPVMLENRILVAEQSMTWQPKRSCSSQHSTLALTGLDGRSERLDPINQLVMSALFQIF